MYTPLPLAEQEKLAHCSVLDAKEPGVSENFFEFSFSVLSKWKTEKEAGLFGSKNVIVCKLQAIRPV
jgi:hypothetical protein